MVGQSNMVTKITQARGNRGLSGTELILDATIFESSLAGGKRYYNITGARWNGGEDGAPDAEQEPGGRKHLFY